MLEGNTSCPKLYTALYPEKGYELGFGKGGRYEGHSHLFYYDIMFSPDGIVLNDEEPNNDCFIKIVPPRTYMNDVRIGNFFFLKFCPTADTFHLPEKSNCVLSEGAILSYSEAMQFDSIWYKTPKNKGHIWIEATPDFLDINFDNQQKIRIVR